METPPQGKSVLSPGFSVSSTHAFPAQPTLEIHQPRAGRARSQRPEQVQVPRSFGKMSKK